MKTETTMPIRTAENLIEAYKTEVAKAFVDLEQYLSGHNCLEKQKEFVEYLTLMVDKVDSKEEFDEAIKNCGNNVFLQWLLIVKNYEFASLDKKCRDLYDYRSNVIRLFTKEANELGAFMKEIEGTDDAITIYKRVLVKLFTGNYSFSAFNRKGERTVNELLDKYGLLDGTAKLHSEK